MNDTQSIDDHFQNVIDKFNELYGEKYSDPSYVYSHCKFSIRIWVYQKLPDTKTNEDSIDVVNPDCAVYRADKLRLVGKYDPVNLNEECMEDSDLNFEYEIQYVKTFAPALYNCLCSFGFQGLSGTHKIYYDNGQLQSCGKCVNGKHCGLWKTYLDTGELFIESTLSNGVVIASTTYYPTTGAVRAKTYFDWSNGKKLEITNFPDGKRERMWIIYDDDQVVVTDIKWYSNGNLRSIFMKHGRDTWNKNQDSYNIEWDSDKNKNIQKVHWTEDCCKYIIKKSVPAN